MGDMPSYGGGFSGKVGFGKKPAVLVIDFISAFTDPASPLGANFDREVEATGSLLAVARQKGALVVFTTVAYEPDYRDGGFFIHKVPALRALKIGSGDTKVDTRLGPRSGDHLVVKKFASAFFGTNIASLFTGQGIDTVIVAGCTTSGCVRASAVDSLQYGFRTIIPEECVGDRAQGPHLANLFDLQAKYADVLSLNDVMQYLNTLETVG